MRELLKIETKYVGSFNKPIRIRLSTFIDMAKGIERDLALKMVYADIIATKYLGTKKRGNQVDNWVLFRNDEQMRAIVQILQNNNILPKGRSYVNIPKLE